MISLSSLRPSGQSRLNKGEGSGKPGQWWSVIMGAWISYNGCDVACTAQAFCGSKLMSFPLPANLLIIKPVLHVDCVLWIHFYEFLCISWQITEEIELKNLIGSACKHSSSQQGCKSYPVSADSAYTVWGRTSLYHTVGYGAGLFGIGIIIGVTLVGVPFKWCSRWWLSVVME